MRSGRYKSIAISVAGLLLLFQNCGQPLSAKKSLASSATSTSSTSTDGDNGAIFPPSPAPVPSPAPAPTVNAPPLTPTDPAVGKLKIFRNANGQFDNFD